MPRTTTPWKPTATGCGPSRSSWTCWDLLRQRRALRDAGADPEEAQARDAGTVEGYQQ
jgi:hypothetical protein